MLVPADDAVGDLAAGLHVPAGGLHPEQLRSRRHVLGHGRRVFPVLEHRRVVVDVQDGDHDLALRGEAGGAPVAGAGLQLVRGLHLPVQRTLQADDAAVLVDGEESVGGIDQRVKDVAVRSWNDR